MARPLRIEFAGVPCHVTVRRNPQADICDDDIDRQQSISLLQDSNDRLGWYCHACCLMDNRYQQLIETNSLM